MTAISLALMATGLPTFAQAQTAPVADNTVDEVVVTARKRSETLTEVPVAISAITAEDRQNLVLDGMKDYLRQAPSTTLVSSGPEYLQDIAIRGQGSGRLGFSEAATGLFKDGLYNSGGGFGGRSLSRLDFLDSQRIEILRGPQGALYGRNSVGGAVNVVSQTPEDLFSGSLVLRYSDPERVATEGVLNLPVADGLFAVRIAGLYDDQHAGFTRNLTTGHDLDKQTFKGLRVAARWTPADATTVDLSFERYESDTPSFSSLGRRPLRADGTVLDPSPWVRADLDREGRAVIKEDAYYLSVQHDLGFADLVLKASSRERDGGRTNEDNDHFSGQSGIDIAPGAAVLTADYAVDQLEDYSRAVGQAYLSSKSGGRTTWLIGVEYLTSTDEVVVDPRYCPAYSGVAQPLTAGCIAGQAGPLTGVPLTVRAGVKVSLNHDEFTEELTSPSLFGSLEFKLSPSWTLGLEARLQQDSKEVDFERYSEDPLVYFGAGALPAGMMLPSTSDPDGAGPLPASPIQFCPPGLAAANCKAGLEAATETARRDWTFFTPALTLRRSFASGTNIYARFATGYRPGGFNTSLPPTTVRSQLAGQLLYDPEYAYSYELGAKGRWRGIQLAAAIYYTWTNNVQVVSAPSVLSRGFLLQNSGDAHVQGYEIEARRMFRMGDSDLMLSASLSSQQGEYEDGASVLLDINGDGIPDNADLGGYEVPRMRDYQIAINAAYTFPLRGDMRGFVSAGLQMADGGYETADNSRSYEGYELFDARFGVRKGDLRFSVFGRNLGDQTYVSQVVNANEFYSEPRVFGAELKLDF